MRNAKTIIVLLTLVLLTGTLNFFYFRDLGGADLSKQFVLAELSSDVVSVRVERTGAPPTVLSFDSGDWRLTSPFSGSADGQTVLRLVDALTQTPVVDVRSDSELLKIGRSRSEFSLEKPVLRVELTTASGETGGYSFGSPTAGNDGIYAAVDGVDAVFIVKSDVLSSVDVSADGFRRRSVFPDGVAGVVSFDVKRDGDSLLEFVRTDAGWTIGGERASEQKITEFLADLTTVNAVGFVWPVGASNETDHASASLLAGYGLDPDGAVTVSINDANGKSRRLSFGKAASDELVYALVQNGGAIVTVPARLKDFAVQPSVMFTDTRLFPVEKRLVEGISVTAGGTLYSLSRGKDGRWKLEAPIVAPADPEVAEDMLSRILSLSSADVLAEGGVSVSVSTNMAKVVVPRESILGKRSFEDLRSREMLRIDAPLVKRIVSTPGEKNAKSTSVVYDRERRQWNVENGTEGVAVDAKGVEEVLAVVNPLKAERVEKLAVSASDLDDFGLDAPFLTLAIDQDSDETVRRNVLVGKKTKGGRFATIGSSEAIFVISDATVRKLTSSVVGR